MSKKCEDTATARKADRACAPSEPNPTGLRQGLLHLGHRDDMDVVGHEAIAVNTEAVAQRMLPQKTEIDPPVVVHKENVLLVIPTLGDMVRFSRHHDTCYSGHKDSIAEAGGDVNYR